METVRSCRSTIREVKGDNETYKSAPRKRKENVICETFRLGYRDSILRKISKRPIFRDASAPKRFQFRTRPVIPPLDREIKRFQKKKKKKKAKRSRLDGIRRFNVINNDYVTNFCLIAKLGFTGGLKGK